MKTQIHPTDAGLRWTMRLVGLLLCITCAVLLTTEAARTPAAVAFLAIGAGVGAVTFFSSWFSAAKAPAPERVRS